jgi:uncharacterized protein
MIRAVLDTNILVSALIGKGPSRSILAAFKEKRFILVTSAELLAELLDVIGRPVFGLSRSDQTEIIGLLGGNAHIVTPTIHVDDCRDAKDNIVLDCALAGRATHIVTGDKDLLALNPYRGISVVTPAVFSKVSG